jgi:hypothetical protein
MDQGRVNDMGQGMAGIPQQPYQELCWARPSLGRRLPEVHFNHPLVTREESRGCLL